MKIREVSSGDFSADKRAAWAEALFQQKQYEAAIQLMEEAVLLAPKWSAGRFRLGELCQAAGWHEKAKKSWLAGRQIDPDDPWGASVQLSLAGCIPSISTLPSAFIETLFDQYAASFDRSLKERLSYRVPDLLMAAIGRVHQEKFSLTLDLGCGTGLMGEKLRDLTCTLQGYDISEGMLQKARAKDIYDVLVKQDLQKLMAREMISLEADLVTAADVLAYIGSPVRLLQDIALLTSQKGLFAFSVEKHDREEDFILRETCRYAYSQKGLIAFLEGAGFKVVSIEQEVIRMDRDEPVEGFIIVAGKMSHEHKRA